MAPPVSRVTTFSTSLVELQTISKDSTWPMTSSLFGGPFLGWSSLDNSWTSGFWGKNFFRVFGMSLLERGRTEKSILRIFSVLIGLPASTHFLRRLARLVLSWLLLSLVSSSSNRLGGCSSADRQPFWVRAKVSWPWGKLI